MPDMISTNEAKREEADTPGAGRTAPARKRRLRRVYWALGGLAGILVLVLGLGFLLRPVGTSRALWTLYIQLTETFRDRDSGFGGDEGAGAASPLPESLLLSTIESGNPVGIAGEGRYLFLQGNVRDFLNRRHGQKQSYLFRIDLEAGQFTPVNNGNLIGATMWGERIAFVAEPHAAARENFLLDRLLPYYSLFAMEGILSRPEALVRGGVDPQAMSFSPGGDRLLYHINEDAGLCVRIHDFSTGADAPLAAPRENSPGSWPTDAEAVAVDWIEPDGDSILRMIRAPIDVQAARTYMRHTPWQFQVCDARTGEIQDQLYGFRDRFLVDHPVYNRAGYFSIHTRDPDNPGSPDAERIDFYRLRPLEHIVSVAAMNVLWTPDRRLALLERRRRRTARLSSEIAVFYPSPGSLERIDLAKLDPPFEQLPSPPQGVLGDNAHLFSPDSRSVIVISLRDRRIGVLNLESIVLGQVVENLVASDFLWSPDSRHVALLRWPHESPVEPPTHSVLDVSTGAIRDYALELMRPLAWMDADRVLWVSRHAGQVAEETRPLAVAVVNVRTGESRHLLGR